MKPLPQRHQNQISAAIGWTELGNLAEAASELDELPPRLRAHPDVLEIRWEIFSRAKNWSACLDLGIGLTKLAPDRATSWYDHAVALQKLGRTEEARTLLLSIVQRFENVVTIHYELARFCCILGRLAEARAWFGKGLDCVNVEEGRNGLKLLALDDPDLIQLWNLGTDETRNRQK